MMILRGGYFFRRALRNMQQSPVLSLASVGTIAVALALLAFFAIAVLNVQQLTASWGESLAIVVYLDEVPGDSIIKGWASDIERYPEVDKVDFVSRDQAFEQFRQRLGDDAGLVEGLGPEVFAALGEALYAGGAKELAYRAFHRAQRLWLEAGDKKAAGRMQVRKDACPRVPDRVIAAEEHEAMIWVEALESYERARVARGEDPTDRVAFFDRYGRPEEDLNAIVRSHRIAFLGSVVGMLAALSVCYHLYIIFSGLIPNLISRPIHLALALPWVFMVGSAERKDSSPRLSGRSWQTETV